MFFDKYEDQVFAWKSFRAQLEESASPFEDAIRFWNKAPLVNKHLTIDDSTNWPTPWQIIKDGKYDDLTVSLMIGNTLKLTKRFNQNQIEIRSYLDTDKKVVYNVCCIDNKILNYPYGEMSIEIPKNFVLQAVVSLADYS